MYLSESFMVFFEPVDGRIGGGNGKERSYQHDVLKSPVASPLALFLFSGDSGPLPVIITLIVVRGNQFILILA